MTTSNQNGEAPYLYALSWAAIWRFRSRLFHGSVVSRYVFDKKPKKVCPSFFGEPDPTGLSVFETSYCSEEKIWQLAKHVNRKRSVKARCQMPVSKINALEFGDEDKKLNLLVRRWPYPCWWHANVKNLPLDQEMFKLAVLRLCESDISTYVSRQNTAG